MLEQTLVTRAAEFKQGDVIDDRVVRKPGKMFLQKLKKMLMYGASFKLRPYEQGVLDAWRRELSPAGNALLSAQLQELCSYQRQVLDKDLCFFPLGRKPYLRLPSEILFPCRLESCVVARIHVAGGDKAGSRSRLRADVVLHKGQVSSIEFNQPPGRKLARDVEVTKVEILRDPMIPASDETTSEAQRREEVLKTINSRLPDEYLELAGESKGAPINEWAVCAVQDIWKIPQRDGNYYVLAVKEGMGIVGIKEDESSGQFYYLDYDSHYGERITVSLRKFFEQFDGGKVVGRF